MRVRPFFWWFFLVVCIGVLGFAITMPTRIPALLHVQYPQHMTSTTSTDLTVQVTDTQELPINDVHFSLQAWMTNMPMGTDAVVITPEQDGIYHIHIQFSMPGPWDLHVLVQPPPGFLPVGSTVSLQVRQPANTPN
jgi:hypothetical protein